MDQAITIGGLIEFIAILGGLIAVPAICIFLVWLFNPFRTGH